MILMHVCSDVHAQNIPDSLLNKLNHAANDSVKTRTLLDIGEMLESTAIEKSFGYYQQALELSRKIKNNRLMLSSLNNVGIAYVQMNKMDSAILTYEQAITIARLLHDTLREARVICNIGNVYLFKKDPARAIDYYLKSAGLWETSADKRSLPALYANINSLLNDQKEYQKALEYGNRAVELAKKIGDDYSIINALLNLSGTYGDLEKFDKQYELLQEALPLAKKGKDMEQIVSIYSNLGDYYFQRSQYQLSLASYLNSYTYVKQLGNKYYLSSTSASLARVYQKLHQKDKALQYIVQAEKVANEVGARADLKDIYLSRAEMEQEAGNYELSANYFAKTLTLTDSLFKSTTSEKVAEIEAKYQDEKKQKEILQLEEDKKIQSLSIQQKSTLNYFLFGSVAALLILVFLGYINFRSRQILAKQQDELQLQRIRELEKDRQLLVVDSMLKGQEEERSRLAKDLHDGLGGLLSGIKFSLSNIKDNLIVTPDNMAVFERALDMLDSSIRELRRVAHNMMPEMLISFGLNEALKEYCNALNAVKLFEVKYQSLGLELRLDKSSEIIIYRIVQELLNNILKHAAATVAFVQLIREGNRFNVVVEDNGKGFDAGNPENNKGAGLANIRSRVDYLKGQLAIHTEPGKGTLVNMEFNIE